MRKIIGNIGNAARLISYKRKSIIQDKLHDSKLLNDTSNNSRYSLHQNCRSNSLGLHSLMCSRALMSIAMSRHSPYRLMPDS